MFATPIIQYKNGSFGVFGVDNTQVSTPADTDIMTTKQFSIIIQCKKSKRDLHTLYVQIRFDARKSIIGTNRLARRRANQRLIKQNKEFLQIEIIIVLANELSDCLSVRWCFRKRIRRIVTRSEKIRRNADLLSLAQRFDCSRIRCTRLA